MICWLDEVRFWKKLAFMKDEKKRRTVMEIKFRGNIEPVTWGVCAMEIGGHTQLGKRMLRILRTKGLL